MTQNGKMQWLEGDAKGTLGQVARDGLSKVAAGFTTCFCFRSLP